MKGSVLLVGKSSKDLETILNLMEKLSYTPVLVPTLNAAEKMIASQPVRIVLLDFDSVRLDNRIIAAFKRRFPRVHLIIISEKRFHPDLREAIIDHIYACVSKPVDPDEMEYWLTSIHQNETRSRDTPFRDTNHQ